ncbi:MAG: EamA family transporter [Candidatus Bathyarchaeota archaeon]|nr:EamA family transporter [Candidatus Bathyarchaeota archaeon]
MDEPTSNLDPRATSEILHLLLQLNKSSGITLLLATHVTACLFWGIDNNLSRFLCVKEDLILVTALKCLLGGISLLLVAYALKLSFYVPLSAFPYLITVGAFSIGFSILFFMVGLKEIGSMRTGMIFSTSSLFGAVFAFIILNEEFTFVQFFAGVVMVFGVYVLYRK